MTTNFPTSVDAFTNPTSNDTLDNPPHDQQHADINDAMEAVQTSLLDGSPLKIDDANNRVGIGTTSPSTALEVSSNTGGGTTSTDLRISSTGQSSTWSTSNAWGVLDFYNADGSGGGAKSHVSLQAVAGEPLGQYSDLQFHVTDGSASDITAMTIEGSSGNVGIGDTTPSYKLDVNGDINSQTDVLVGGNSLPRGLVAFAQRQSSYGLTTTLNIPLSTTGNVVSGRKYLVSWTMYTYATSTTMLVTSYAYIGGAEKQKMAVSIDATGDNGNLSGFTVYTATATGNVTFEIRALTSTGTTFVQGTSTYGPAIAVYDLGA